MCHMTRVTWHVTCYTWHRTHDTWHVKPDSWLVVNILSRFQVSSSNGLGVMMFWRFGGEGWPTKWMNKWVSDQPYLYMRNKNKKIWYVSLKFNVYFHFVVSAEFQIIEDKGNVSLLFGSFRWHVTPDMWQLTCATWHLTPDTWHATHDIR
jgi:hypothetical protein